jgi:hypothetical protein
MLTQYKKWVWSFLVLHSYSEYSRQLKTEGYEKHVWNEKCVYSFLFRGSEPEGKKETIWKTPT